MTLVPNSLDEIDYWDLDMFEHGDPHAAWRLQREQAPVWFHDRPGGEKFWSVTKFDDCKAVHADPRLYSSQTAGIMIQDEIDSQREDMMAGVNPMIHTDPPRHGKLRKLISPRFTPRSIAELEEQLRGFASNCFDEAAEKGEVDFVNDIAHKIPAAIALSLMGVPEDAWDRLAELEQMTVTRDDPEFTGGQDAREVSSAASMELGMYFAGLVMPRMEEPGDDLLSEYIKGQIDGEDLPLEQVVAEAVLLLAGGLDTTRAAASAGGMLALFEHPDQLRDLQRDPTLVHAAVEEFVRWASPITSEGRIAMADTSLGGHDIAAGDRVVIWSPSANRDPDHFADPDRYDIRREPNRHLGFAFGEHYCLGVHLARLTLRVEFEELFKRFSSIEQIGDAVRVRSNFVGGLKHLPVRLTPR